MRNKHEQCLLQSTSMPDNTDKQREHTSQPSVPSPHTKACFKSLCVAYFIQAELNQHDATKTEPP